MVPKLAGKKHTLGVYYFRVHWFRVGLLSALLSVTFLASQEFSRVNERQISRPPKVEANEMLIGINEPVETLGNTVIAEFEPESVVDLTSKRLSQMALSERHYGFGRIYYEEFKFEEAKSSLEKSLAADPENTKARYLLQLANFLLGESSESYRICGDSLREERSARLRLERFELRMLYERGSALFKDKKFDMAIRKLEQVLERIKWSPYNTDNDGLEDRARKQIIEARQGIREQDIEEREAGERSSFDSVSESEESIQSLRRRMVQILLKRAIDELRAKNFESAKGTIREVLSIDSDNKTARCLQQLVKEE